MDPIGSFSATNTPKYFLIVIAVALLLTLNLPSVQHLMIAKSPKSITYLVIFSLTWSSISLFVNKDNLDERLFGVYGRNLGFITFFSMFLLLWGSLSFLSKWISAFFVSISLSALVVASYFTLQYFGIDFGVWEETYGKTPSSSLGNPNYVIALIAIGLTLSLSFLILQPKKAILLRTFSIIILISGISIMSLADSFQGNLILGVAFAQLIIFKFFTKYKEKVKKVSKKSIMLFAGLLSLGLIATLFAQGALLRELTSGSAFARLDYWRASMNMILKSPIFGFGFDSFGDYYTQYRDGAAVVRSAGLFSDSPHNFLFELATFAGLPLAISYIFIQIQILRSTRDALKNANARESFYLVTLLTYWTGFHIQSLVNPSSLALLSLQFITCGVLFSYSYSVAQEKFLEERSKKNLNFRKKSGINLGQMLLTLFIGALLIPLSIKFGVAPWEKDRAFKEAATKGDGAALILISKDWPFTYALSELTARTLLENQYEELGMKVVRDLVETNPRNLRGWRLLFDRSKESSERALAISKLKELDPLNPEYDQMKP
jgi:O-antigen ligase